MESTFSGRSKEMATTNSRIKDLKSFNEVTKEPHQIAGLYFYAMLDCLIDLARDVSRDFFDRPHLYTDVANAQIKEESASIAPILAKLHIRYGSDEYLLSKLQRQQIYAAIFGPVNSYGMNGDSNFARLRNDLVNACAAFAERVYDTGVDMLRERVRSAHRPFQEYLTGFLGDSIRWSREETLASLTEEVVYPILRTRGIAAVFGISTPAREEWPYVEDANGDKLAEEIAKQLNESAHTSELREHVLPTLTRDRLSNLQRAALRGAEAIATSIDFDESSIDADLSRLISQCYTWGSALMGLNDYVIALESSPSTGPVFTTHRPALAVHVDR
jgi:hypothetical protein